MKRFTWEKKYLYIGVTALSIVILSIAFFMSIQNMQAISGFIKNLLGIMSPVLWGLVIAYLLYSPMMFFEARLFIPLSKRFMKHNPKTAARAARALSVVLAIAVSLVIIFTLLWLVIPQVLTSITVIAHGMPSYVGKAMEWIEKKMYSYPEAESIVVSAFESISEYVVNWLQSTVVPQIQKIVAGLSTGVFAFFKVIANIFIGIIFSIYLLFNKEGLGAKTKKLLYAIFSPKTVKRLLRGAGYTNDAFMGFISGQLLDSTIVGVICYISCSLMQIEYALLVGAVVGVTNIIPFFGPFIGAVPSAIIILMDSPWKCLMFLIFILILQQVDGNIISPRILGDRVGLNGFWIMLAIIVGGGLFGFAGMICGVPVFTVLYGGLRSFVNGRLKSKGLPVDAERYGKGIAPEPAGRHITGMLPKPDELSKAMEKDGKAEKSVDETDSDINRR